LILRAISSLRTQLRVETRNKLSTKATGAMSIRSMTLKECMSDPVPNYNYIKDAKISVSIKKQMPTNAH